jgi:hypothetical protein
MTEQATLSPALVREHLLTKYTDNDALVREYCNEAEHQEGEEVWEVMYQNDMDQIDEDFELYRENSSNPSGGAVSGLPE